MTIRFLVVLAAACLVWPALAAGDTVVDVSETSSGLDVADWHVLGYGPGNFDEQTNSGTDFIFWGKDTGAFSSKLTDKTDGVPQPPNVPTYPNASNPKSWGSISVGDLRNYFTTELGLQGQYMSNFPIYVTLNELTGGGELPMMVNDLVLEFRDSGGTPLVRYDLVDGGGAYDLRLLNDVQTGQSISDYRFTVPGGLDLHTYADTDVMWVDLQMSTLSDGQEIWWADEPFEFILATDYGDAPDSYGTLLASDGARHEDTAYEWIGATVDGEADGNPDAAAYGDNQHRTNDEEGVEFLRDGVNVTLTVADRTDPRYDTGQLYLDGWIDYGQDGSFAEPGDHVVAGFTQDPRGWASNSETFFISTPYIPPGRGVFSRWRLVYGGSAIGNPTGLALFGEVEDYFVIPEPASVVVLGGALALLARRRRRRG